MKNNKTSQEIARETMEKAGFPESEIEHFIKTFVPEKKSQKYGESKHIKNQQVAENDLLE